MSEMNGADTVEVKARDMGWKPLEEFKGDPDNWRDAEAFVARGEEILPIVRKDNERLRAEVAQTKAETARLKALVDAGQEAIIELKSFHTADTQRQVEKAQRDLRSGIKQAKAEGNEDLEETLREELTEINAALKEAKETPKRDTPLVPAQPTVDPAFISWRNNNPWFEVDTKKTALTVAIAQELRADPKNVGLLGEDFYKRAAAGADEILNPRPGRGQSKLEEGGGGVGLSGVGGPEGKTFRDLPSDARAVCEKQATKLVGEGRAFKTKEAWRNHYVEQYFLGE